MIDRFATKAFLVTRLAIKRHKAKCNHSFILWHLISKTRKTIAM